MQGIQAHRGGRARGAGENRAGMKDLGRALRYLRRHRMTAAIAYFALFVSTGAMLMVPRLVSNIIDEITGGVMANMFLDLPPQVLSQIAQQQGTTVEALQARAGNAESAIIAAGAAIIAFAIARGLFSFVMNYMAERLSQSIAYDLRNELFAKIQHLSFSYHDRNQTGQLMIRATDDVEIGRAHV